MKDVVSWPAQKVNDFYKCLLIYVKYLACYNFDKNVGKSSPAPWKVISKSFKVKPTLKDGNVKRTL